MDIKLNQSGGKMHGLVIYWYEGGQIEKDHHYFEGDKHGVFIARDDESNLMTEKVYNMGELVSGYRK